MAANRTMGQIIVTFVPGGNFLTAITRIQTTDSDNPGINFAVPDNFDVLQSEMTAQEITDVTAAIQTLKAVLEAHRPIVS